MITTKIIKTYVFFRLSLCLEPPSPSCSSSNSKDSVVETGNTVASLNLSPAKGGNVCCARLHQATTKFAPGHRKSRSLGSK